MPDPLIALMKARSIGPEPSHKERLDKQLAGDEYLRAGNIDSLDDFGFMGGTVGASSLSSRGALKELLKIIKDYSTDMDPLRSALTQRATPAKVYHRSPINVPEGFELPKEFGPNFTARPKSMIDAFVAQKAAPFPESKVTLRASDPRNNNKFKANTKLTDDQVRAIREMLTNNPDSASELAEQYKVSIPTIKNLVSGGYKWVK